MPEHEPEGVVLIPERIAHGLSEFYVEPSCADCHVLGKAAPATAAQDRIDGGVHDEPHDVDEVPVDPRDLDAVMVLPASSGRGTPARQR